MKYNWQQKDWPRFQYDLNQTESALLVLAEKVGRVDGLVEGLSESTKSDALIDIIVSEAVKTSEIEGEYLSRRDVMSSVRNNLGLNKAPEQVKDRKAEGAAELMLDVRHSYMDDLTEEKLFEWHTMLMKGSRGRLKVGAWRDHKEPMQVISGPIGKEKVHYEAPPSSLVPTEMKRFIQWFNDTGPQGKNKIDKPAIRSAIAHLYFETIHPFEDGNGRVGRAISEKSLSQGMGRPVILSLSRTIEANKNKYYEALKTAQRSNEVTPWVTYFVNVILSSQTQAEEQISFTLQKTKFFDLHEQSLNERQLRVIRRMIENGPNSFEGGMSAKKYISITKTSKATATRDLQDLVDKGAFTPIGGGRSTKYEVNMGQ